MLGLGIYNEMSITELIIRLLNISTWFGASRMAIGAVQICSGWFGIKATRYPASESISSDALNASWLFVLLYTSVYLAAGCLTLAGAIATTSWVVNVFRSNLVSWASLFMLFWVWVAVLLEWTIRGHFTYTAWRYRATLHMETNFGSETDLLGGNRDLPVESSFHV